MDRVATSYRQPFVFGLLGGVYSAVLNHSTSQRRIGSSHGCQSDGSSDCASEIACLLVRSDVLGEQRTVELVCSCRGTSVRKAERSLTFTEPIRDPLAKHHREGEDVVLCWASTGFCASSTLHLGGLGGFCLAGLAAGKRYQARFLTRLCALRSGKVPGSKVCASIRRRLGS